MRVVVPVLLGAFSLAACGGESPPTVDDLVAFQASGANRALRHRGVSTPLALTVHLADGAAVPVPWTAFAGDRATVGDLVVTVTLTADALGWSVRAATPVRGVELTLGDLPAAVGARVIVDGAQSWSFAGALEVPAGQALPRDPQGRVRFPETLGDPLADAAHTSVFHGEVAGAFSLCVDDGDGRNTRWSAVTFERPGEGLRVRVFDGLLDDDAARAPGSDGRYTRAGRITVARAHPGRPFACVRSPAQPPRTPPPFPRGWWSWNTLFARVTAADLDRQVTAMAALDPAAKHVTVDDGWEERWGDWRPSTAFGGAVEGVAQGLHARGYTLGLWLAPFAVDPASTLVTEHPGWFLRQRDGAPLRADLVPGRSFAILDATHPEARAHLTALFRGLRAAGVDLFKIDFLYAAARPALRADPTATGLEAYTRGLQAIVEGAGGAHINGCGAVLAPTLPWVQSVRVGADNTFERVTPGWGSVLALARNLSARGWVVDRGVTLDPDQPVTRELTSDEGRAYLAVAAMTGAFGYGDDLTALDDARRGLYREPWFIGLRDTLPGSPARPQDAGESPARAFLPSPLADLVGAFRAAPRARTPTVFALTTPSGPRWVLLHADAEPRSVRVRRATNAVARELVADAPVRVDGDDWVVEVPPRAVRVLRAE
ncbi:MAG: glycoside hydrolase family 36 protein [Polyangiales bacterium]